MTELVELAKASGSNRAHARLLHVAAMLAIRQGDIGMAWADEEQRLAICRNLGDREGIADALAHLGLTFRRQRHRARPFSRGSPTAPPSPPLGRSARASRPLA